MPHYQTVQIPLPKREYRVLIGANILAAGIEHLRSLNLTQRVALISEERVASLHLPAVQAALQAAGYQVDALLVPPGEASKDFSQVAQLCEQLAAAGHDRHSWVLALGGGVLGDLAGFVAAIFYRGIPFVQMPTTVVAQVDSSVGGKTGVNLAVGKNLAGAFHQPRAVIADTTWLETLPESVFAEGLAEVIKHAAIADWQMLERLADFRPGNPALPELIARNVQIKAQIVQADEQERTGQRAFLNFGHTLGHAIEAAAGYGEMLHGQAISLGIRAALHLSEQLQGLDPKFSSQVLQALQDFNLPLQLPEDQRYQTQTLLRLMARDKKFESGKNRFVLLKAPAQPCLQENVPKQLIEETIENLRQAR